MKKLLIVFTMLLLISLTYAESLGSSGRNYTEMEKHFGFKGGTNFSIIKSDGWPDAKSNIGFSGGFFYEIQYSEKLSFQPELLFSMKGWNREYVSYDEDQTFLGEVKYRENFNYIEIPVLGKLKLFSQDNIALYALAGPCFGINISSSNHYDPYYEDDHHWEMDEINVFEFSMIPGAILEFKDKYIFEIRNSYGLTNIYKGDGSIAKNSVFSILFGVKY
ncbi:MAG: porin family protein [Candidatus Stygibacter australis]|nr:porin family protein [Candidatus Stygibacter australis]MDP8322057.1 porin family protein [Candidatus Stygibacter australis]